MISSRTWCVQSCILIGLGFTCMYFLLHCWQHWNCEFYFRFIEYWLCWVGSGQRRYTNPFSWNIIRFILVGAYLCTNYDDDLSTQLHEKIRNMSQNQYQVDWCIAWGLRNGRLQSTASCEQSHHNCLQRNCFCVMLDVEQAFSEGECCSTFCQHWGQRDSSQHIASLGVIFCEELLESIRGLQNSLEECVCGKQLSLCQIWYRHYGNTRFGVMFWLVLKLGLKAISGGRYFAYLLPK